MAFPSIAAFLNKSYYIILMLKNNFSHKDSNNTLLRLLYQNIRKRIIESISIKFSEVDFIRILSAILVKSLFQPKAKIEESIEDFIFSYTSISCDFSLISLFLDELKKHKIIEHNLKVSKTGYEILAHLVTHFNRIYTEES